MASAPTLVHDIRLVTRAVQEGNGLRVAFEDGSFAHLARSHPYFAALRINAESARGSPRPVGVVLDSDSGIVDLNVCHDTSVRSVAPFSNDPGRFQVTFWGYSPVCGLTSDQGDFDRIHAALTEAIQTGRMVWVAVHTSEAVEDEPDEDGLIAMLPKILDARPA